MTSSLRHLLIGGTALVCFAAADLAFAQPLPPVTGQPAAPAPPPAPGAAPAPLYDTAQLPATKGTVSRYTLTPRGDVDGLILADGTEVHFPPHLSTQLVYVVKPGDSVTVRGLKALGTPLIAAVSITNDSTGQAVTDSGPGFGLGPRGPRGATQTLSIQGRVQTVLHGPRGEINGAMLDDGTILRMPPAEAARFAALLTPGQAISAQGDVLITPMGRVVAVQAIGSPGTQLSAVQPPPPPPGKRGPRR
jgi:hypothetical protein